MVLPEQRSPGRITEDMQAGYAAGLLKFVTESRYAFHSNFH
jgi:hypothetical protein